MAKINPYGKTPVSEFNPLAKAKTPKGTKLTASKMFDDKGEINASSKVEALQKIAGLLEDLASGEHNVEKTASFGDGLGVEESDAMLKTAFQDPHSEEFRLVGQALLNPIKEVIDYEGMARKVFAPRSVKSGEVVRYDKDVFVKAWVIGVDGQTPESQAEGKYVYPPEFEVTANVSLELKDKFRAQFDIVARAADRARQSIEHAEDVAMVNALQAAGNAENVTTLFATLNTAALEGMRYQIERHRLVCDKFLINRQEVSDLINVVAANVDPVTQRELLMAGYIGNFLNAKIITTAGTQTFEILQPGEAIAVTAPEYLGGMPIRVELFSEPYNQMMLGLPRQGWFWYELLGMFVNTPGGVALGQRL
jgi:hypothetical protein